MLARIDPASAHAQLDSPPYRQAMHAAGAGVALLDLQGCWVEINPALARLLGADAAACVGQPLAQWVPPEDADAVRAWLAALVAGDAVPAARQQRLCRRDGGMLWTQLAAGVIGDAAGAAQGLIVQVQDIDPLRRALDASHAGVEALGRQQEVLAYGISHDLRAPLRAIDSFAGLLERKAGEQLDADSRGYLQRIRAAAARMGGLMDALLELSRIDRAELQPVPVDLGLLAELALAELQEAEPERVVELDVAADLLACGDERLLRLLMTQLLHNAWQFSADCAHARIQVDGRRAGDRLQLAVRDNGCGFDMRYAEKLFEPFQRLHGPEHGSGHGIGLAIAIRIVQRHGGRLWAQSEPGAGSVFHLELPATTPPTESAEPPPP